MQRRHKLSFISPFSPVFLFYAVVVLALLGCVAAKPAPVGMRRTTETVYRRQAGDPTKQAVTVQTVQVTNTTLGPVTETCQITLSPAKGHKNLVKEVKQCTYAMGANNAGGGNADSSASASATDSASATASATDSAASAASTTDASSTASAASSTDASASSASASSSAAVSAVSSAATTSVAAPAASANGVSSIPLASVTALAGSTSAAVSSAADSTSAAATAAGAAASGVSASDTASATAAPDLASSSASASASPAAAFQIPGKKLSVLPIGLGIFAGISVIALIVVGLVTYERTKYRKAFRQRKLAEQGQSMGYGGMVQQAA